MSRVSICTRGPPEAVYLCSHSSARPLPPRAIGGGERWVWYALLSWPLLRALIYVLYIKEVPAGSSAPPPLTSAPVLLALSLVGLVLSYRIGLPKEGLLSVGSSHTGGNVPAQAGCGLIYASQVVFPRGEIIEEALCQGENGFELIAARRPRQTSPRF